MTQSFRKLYIIVSNLIPLELCNTFTPEPITVPDIPPPNVTAIVLNSTAIKISWDNNSAACYRGIVTVYEIQLVPLQAFDILPPEEINITNAQ